MLVQACPGCPGNGPVKCFVVAAGEPELASCTLDYPSPFIPELKIHGTGLNFSYPH